MLEKSLKFQFKRISRSRDISITSILYSVLSKAFLVQLVRLKLQYHAMPGNISLPNLSKSRSFLCLKSNMKKQNIQKYFSSSDNRFHLFKFLWDFLCSIFYLRIESRKKSKFYGRRKSSTEYTRWFIFRM